MVHPVAIKYRFRGDIEDVTDEVLTDIEHRLSWQPQRHLSVHDRLVKTGRALLCLKEIEHFGAEQRGKFADRLNGLIDRLLQPLEEEWGGNALTGLAVPRVKALRMKLLPDMVNGDLSQDERDRRWKQLANMYLAQQVACYPSDYLATPTIERLLETLERFEEDLTDQARVHGNLHVVIDVGEAIEVDTHRDRKAEVDPLMARIEEDLQAGLDRLAAECTLYEQPAG